MDNNELLMIVLAFVVGYMCSGMMKQMCGGRLVEGSDFSWDGMGCTCTSSMQCQRGLQCTNWKCEWDPDYDPNEGLVDGYYDRVMEDWTRKGRDSSRDCNKANPAWGMD